MVPPHRWSFAATTVAVTRFGSKGLNHFGTQFFDLVPEPTKHPYNTHTDQYSQTNGATTRRVHCCKASESVASLGEELVALTVAPSRHGAAVRVVPAVFARAEADIPQPTDRSESVVAALVALMVPVVMVRHLRKR